MKSVVKCCDWNKHCVRDAPRNNFRVLSKSRTLAVQMINNDAQSIKSIGDLAAGETEYKLAVGAWITRSRVVLVWGSGRWH